MPELPEVEAVCRKLRRELMGMRITDGRVERPIVTSPQKPQWIISRVAGRTVEAIERRGKHILVRLSGGWVLLIHLRMTGNLLLIPDVRLRSLTTRVWFEMEGGRGLVLDDPRSLGKVRLLRPGEEQEALASLGVEPLSSEFTIARFLAIASRSRQPAKLFLMDQRRIAGMGNIYAVEALFRAGIHPARPVHRIGRARLEALHGHISGVLQEAAASAEIAYSSPGRFVEAEEFVCAVYGRQGELCSRCGRTIRRMRQEGRSTYYCAGCQR
jgi:formamidopyrimidine-DNA glycosylase